MKARVQDLKSIIAGRIDGFVVSLRNTVAFAANPWRARWQLLDGRVQRMVLIGVAARPRRVNVETTSARERSAHDRKQRRVCARL